MYDDDDDKEIEYYNGEKFTDLLRGTKNQKFFVRALIDRLQFYLIDIEDFISKVNIGGGLHPDAYNEYALL